MDPKFSADDQLRLLLMSDRINFSPSYFFNKEAVVSVGGYDERNNLQEDYPMWLKLSRAGFKFYFMDKITVGYRQHAQATSNTGRSWLFAPAVLRMQEFKKRDVYPYLPSDLVGLEKFKVGVSWLFDTMHLNRDTAILRWMYRLLTVYANPFVYVVFFKRKVLRRGSSNIFYRY